MHSLQAPINSNQLEKTYMWYQTVWPCFCMSSPVLGWCQATPLPDLVIISDLMFLSVLMHILCQNLKNLQLFFSFSFSFFLMCGICQIWTSFHYHHLKKNCSNVGVILQIMRINNSVKRKIILWFQQEINEIMFPLNETLYCI